MIFKNFLWFFSYLALGKFFGIEQVLYLLAKKTVTWKKEILVGGSVLQGFQHPVIGWPCAQAVVHLSPNPFCPGRSQSPSLNVDPATLLASVGTGQSPLFSCPKSRWLLKEFLAETLRGLPAFLSIVGRVLFNQVWWKLTSAGSHFWISFSSFVKSPWSA